MKRTKNPAFREKSNVKRTKNPPAKVEKLEAIIDEITEAVKSKTDKKKKDK